METDTEEATTVYGPAHKILVLIAQTSSESSANAHFRQSFCFLHTQSMEVEIGSDQKLYL